MGKKIVIAGSRGFIGSALMRYFKEHGIETIPLVRDRKEKGIYWDPLQQKIESDKLEKMDGVINLCGESIFGRWTSKKLERIRSSRLETTKFLCATLVRLQSPPSVYIGASAVGYYGERGEEILTENSPRGQGILPLLCEEWEGIAATQLKPIGIRTVFTRFGVVFGKGGALGTLSFPFRLGLGGKLGSGRQKMSWIAIDDLVRAMRFVIEHEEIKGPVNFVSPFSITNKEMTLQIGKILHRPTPFSIPSWGLSLLLGKGAEAFLSSAQAIPKKLLTSGFVFKFPCSEEALKNYLPIKK